MKIGKLVYTKSVLAPLCKEKLSPRLSYKLMKFISKIEEDEAFFNEKMREIVDMYGEKDAEGNLVSLDGGIKIKEECRSECNKAVAELHAIDVEVPNITFTLDELSEVKLSVEDMMALDEFIKE